MLRRADSHRRSQGQRCVSHPRPSDVLRLCDRGERGACCTGQTLTGGHKVRDASSSYVPAMFCDFVTAVRDGLAATSKLSPAVTGSEMRLPATPQRCSRRSQGQRGAVCPTFFRDPPLGDAPPPTSQRCSATLRPTLTGGHKVRDASPTHVPPMFCDFATAVGDGLAAQGRLSPGITRPVMRHPPTSQRPSATL